MDVFGSRASGWAALESIRRREGRKEGRKDEKKEGWMKRRKPRDER